MQAYFDRDDAELEFRSIFAKGSHSADFVARIPALIPDRSTFILGVVASLVLGLCSFWIAAHPGALPWQELTVSHASVFETKFVIETIKPPAPKQVQKPKPVVKAPVPTPTVRLRSVPSTSTQIAQHQMPAKGRAEARDAQRISQQEASMQRSSPGTISQHTAAVGEFEQRDLVHENSDRSTTTTIRPEQTRDPVGEVNATHERTATESGLSRVKLDPYHYQMVNVCLRQCARTMFTHAGLDEQEKNKSKSWLRVARSNESYFEILHGGRWTRIYVDVSRLGDISNIDFVRVAGNSSGIESLFETATRKLCGLLGYDDCFAKL